jgi:hypothetical protein
MGTLVKSQTPELVVLPYWSQIILEPSSLPSSLLGTIFHAASADISFSTAGNVALVTLDGRALALKASVTIVNTVVNVPAP